MYVRVGEGPDSKLPRARVRPTPPTQTIADCVAELPVSWGEKQGLRGLRHWAVCACAGCCVGYTRGFGKGLRVGQGGGQDPPYPTVISYHIISKKTHLWEMMRNGLRQKVLSSMCKVGMIFQYQWGNVIAPSGVDFIELKWEQWCCVSLLELKNHYNLTHTEKLTVYSLYAY